MLDRNFERSFVISVGFFSRFSVIDISSAHNQCLYSGAD